MVWVNKNSNYLGCCGESIPGRVPCRVLGSSSIEKSQESELQKTTPSFLKDLATNGGSFDLRSQ